MPKRTYLDTGVFIAALQGKNEVGRRAVEILDDPDRILVTSDAVRLEVLPKPHYEKKQEEIAFYDEIFSRSERLKWHLDTLDSAYKLAKKYGIAAMDAIHVATALAAGVDEMVTTEKPSKPLFRVKEINVRSLL